MKETRDPRRLVFVGGLHRSGTTPLASALAQHSDISGLRDTRVREDEGQHLQSVYPRAKVYGGPGRFALAPEAHLTEGSSLATPDAADRLWDSWEPYWDTTASYLVEKSPPNVIMGRFLQAVFPGSALVVVLRHPVVVALSTWKWRRLASRHWRNHTTLEQMVAHWVAAYSTFLDDLPHLDRVLVVHYERLVAGPESELARIQALLGLPTPIPHESLTRSHSGRYESAWEELASGSVLERRQRRLIVERHAEAIARFGYSVRDLRAMPPSSAASTSELPLGADAAGKLNAS